MDCYLGDNGNGLALVYDPSELLGSRSKLICQSYYPLEPYLISHITFYKSSWTTASLSQLDAPAAPTRILLSFKITSHHNDDYMIAELLLSPISATPSDTPSLSPIVDDTPQSDYLLTY